MPTPLASLNQVHYSAGGRLILDGFSLAIAPGERVLLSGPSGSGKTSVIRLLAGLAEPESGEASRSVSRSHISYLPQDADLSDHTLDQFYSEVYSWKAHQDHDYDRSRAAGMLADLGLSADALSTAFRDLSGGERQRALLALALMLDKKLNILDEPSSGLDAASERKVFECVTTQLSGAVLVVSHDEIWKQTPFRVVRLEGAGASS